MKQCWLLGCCAFPLRSVALALAMVLHVGAPPAMAADQTVTLAAVRDNSIYFGTADSDNRSDGAGPHLWLAITAEGLGRRALLQFDLSAIPAGAVVQEVTLSLFASRMRDAHDVQVHRLLQSWGEGASEAGGSGTGVPAAPGDATWINRFHPGQPWANPGGDFIAEPSATTTVNLPNVRFNWVGLRTANTPVPRLVQDVQGWVDAPASNHGWIFIGDESRDQNAKRLESRNNPVVANRPRLVVRYTVPEPVASDGDVPLPLWAIGLLATLIGGVMVRSDHQRRR